MTSLTVFGLVLDIVGVLFLGMAFAATPDRFLKQVMVTYRGADFPPLLSLVTQRADARVGLPFLVIGFFFQGLGAAGIALPGWGVLTLSGVTFAITGGAIAWRGVCVQSDYRRLANDLLNGDDGFSSFSMGSRRR